MLNPSRSLLAPSRTQAAPQRPSTSLYGGPSLRSSAPSANALTTAMPRFTGRAGAQAFAAPSLRTAQPGGSAQPAAQAPGEIGIGLGGGTPMRGFEGTSPAPNFDVTSWEQPPRAGIEPETGQMPVFSPAMMRDLIQKLIDETPPGDHPKSLLMVEWLLRMAKSAEEAP